MKKYIRLLGIICILLLLTLIFLNPPQSTSQSTPRRTTKRILQNIIKPLNSNQLIDLQNFSYIMAQPECAPDVSALFLVHSAPQNFERRTRIRQTWGLKIWFNSGTPFRLIFLLGSVKQQQVLQLKLQQENAMFYDMLQGNFIDDYKNMTYKHVMAYRWLIQYCSHAQVLIKLDDDTLVNTPQLIKYLESRNLEMTPVHSKKKIFNPARQLFDHPKDLILCQKRLKVRANRSYRSKWRIGKKAYTKRFFPPYCVGFAIIYSTDVVSGLYRGQQTMKYFWIDDMHLTGTIASQLNYSLTNMLPYVLSKSDLASILDDKKNFLDFEFMFAYYNIPKEKYIKLWQLIWLNYDLRTNKGFHF